MALNRRLFGGFQRPGYAHSWARRLALKKTFAVIALSLWLMCSLVMSVSLVGLLGLIVMEESDNYSWMAMGKELVAILKA